MKQKDKKQETKESTTVAMYPSLKERVTEAAKKDGRSFSDYICRILEKNVG